MRLEALGFSDVFDYAGGKRDWLAEGMPGEGDRAGELRAGSVARGDAPTCRPGTTVQRLAGRNDVDVWGRCVVTDEEGTVHGLLISETIGSARPEEPVDRVMERAPLTIRPDASLASTLENLEENSSDSVLITTSRGRLLGILFADDLRATSAGADRDRSPRH